MSELFPWAVEHLLPEDQAKEIITPFREDFTQVWFESQAEWDRMPEDQRARLMQTPLVPPIIMFGYAQSYAKEIFSNREAEGIVRCPELQVFGFYIHEKVLVRFNALGSDHVVHNTKNGTDRKELYFSQEPIFGINNSATRLTVGPIHNAAKTDITAVVASCQVGDSLHYSFRVDDAHGGVVPMPSAVNPPQPDSLSENLSKRKPR